jgi:hypothetical protein
VPDSLQLDKGTVHREGLLPFQDQVSELRVLYSTVASDLQSALKKIHCSEDVLVILNNYQAV